MKRRILLVSVIFTFLILCSFIFTKNEAKAYSAYDSNGIYWYFDIINGEAQNLRIYSTNYGTTVTVPETIGGYTVTSIGQQYSNSYGMFYNSNYTSNRSNITTVILPNTLKKIGQYTFAYCYSLNTIVIPDSVETIDNFAFYNCGTLKSVNLPSNLKRIGNYAFEYSAIQGNIVFPEGLQEIGNGAYDGTSISGDLTIPDSVTTLGSSAFEYCRSLNGILNVGSGVTNINGYTFFETKFTRVNLGPVTTIGYRAFEGYDDIWVDNEEENVSLNSSGISGDGKFPTIHYRGCTHKVDVYPLPGLRLVNTVTGEELVSGDYPCESEFEFELVLDPGTQYDNLQIIIVDNNDTTHFKSYTVDSNNTYTFETLTKDRKIYVQNLSAEPDFALRMFVTEVNRNLVSRTRIPVFDMNEGNFEYLHTKSPVKVKTGDLVTYRIRVYNESSTAAAPGKVAVYIPDGLQFDSTNRTNVSNGWTFSNGVAVTSKLESTNIAANVGNGVAKFKEIEIALKVTAEKESNEDIFRAIFAEIYGNSVDADSTAGNINIPSYTDYRTDELFDTANNSYVTFGEDDEDFETVYIKGKIKVDYNIVINKIDGETKELLQGAKFKLTDKDGNEIAVVESDLDGIVDFGGLSTYGSGTDIYYIQEIQTPDGYYLTDNKKIRVKVEKTILNEDNGLYSLKVSCDTLAYTIDTTRYDFTPIYTIDQFRKIGSGEMIEIDGVKYQYNIDTNYKLMADLDFSADGVDPRWTPIDHEMKCIIDGDGHKIKGLVITGNNLEYSEVGIFSVFSGIVQNLEIENMVISFNGFVDEPYNISGKTGVGLLAGVMRDGYIINCKTSGVIATGVDNVGGFVGHTLENGIVRIDGCKNYAELHGQYQYEEYAWDPVGNDNAGGLIGCALGSVSVNNSENYGQITTFRYNAGGLVGCVEPSEYQDISINTAYDEDNKILNLLVENITTEADYTVHLQDIDIDTEEALLGGVYTVYDGGKNILDGMENMELDEIMKKIVERQLRAVGLDTYYIIEDSPVPGYEPINGIVKLDVERYWDEETKSYRFRIEASIISDIKYEVAEPNVRLEKPIFDRGDIFTDVKIEKANMNTEKSEFIGCTNYGELVGNYLNCAGIVAASRGYTYIEKCKNEGHINCTAYGRTGGIVAELYAFKEDSVIKDCENNAEIENGSQGKYAPAGGIAGCVCSDLTITNCKNTADIIGVGEGGIAGILGDARGYLTIDSCENSGFISASSGYNYENAYSVDSIAAGIIAKNCYYYQANSYQTTSRQDSTLTMTNCKNTGDIYSSCHTGGMVAFTDALWLKMTDCETSNCYIHDVAGDKGGMVGFLQIPNVEIKNCITDTVDLRRTSTITNNTYGCTGAMVGNWTAYGWNGCNLDTLVISNCTAIDSTIHTNGQNVGGMLGIQIESSNYGDPTFTDCYVKNCTIINDRIVGTYGAAGGIFGNTYGAGDVKIRNCTVEDSLVMTRVDDPRYGGDVDAGGIFGMGQSIRSMEVEDCDVINSTVDCISQHYKSEYTYNGQTYVSYSGDGCTATGGIVAEVGTGIDHCDISGCNVIDTLVRTNSGTIGGIIGHSGVTSGNYSDQNDYRSHVTDCTFKGGSVVSNSYTTTASITSGILGYCSGRSYFENCLVEDAFIDARMENTEAATNTSGIFGMASYGAKFINCDVKNTDFISSGAYGSGDGGLSNVAGIAGCTGGATYIEDCDVEGCTFTGYKAANVAALLGCDYDSSYGAFIENCSAIDCTMDNWTEGAARGSNCTVGGLVGVVGSGYIKNSIVDGCTLIGKATCTGGLIGVANGYSNEYEIDNVTVSNTEINDTGVRTYNRCLGGFVGSMNNPLKLTNSSAENITINSKTQDVGGVLGYAGRDSSISNVDINDVTINNTSEYGGANGGIGGLIGMFGCSSGPGSDLSTITINNVNVTDSEISDIFAEGVSGYVYIGGLLGYAENTNINNSSVTSTDITNPSYGHTGGLVGMMYRYNNDHEAILNVNNSSYSNSDINSNSFAGGIAGMVNETTFNNVSVSDANITNNGNFSIAGGMVGIVPNSSRALNVSNSSVTDGVITSTAHTGGLLGLGKINATNNTLSDITVGIPQDNSGAIIGGMVGIAQSGSVINGVTASDITVTPKSCSAGGLAGKFEGTISNVNLDTVSVLLNSGWGEIGGVVGIQYGNLSNITVNNANIKGMKNGNSYGDVGGIVGISFADITGARVTNSTVLSDKEAGGIAGVLNGNLSNSSCDSVSVTVSGATKDDLGYWQGGDCGGAVGACQNTLSNITVTNSTITNTHKLAGAILGAGYSETSQFIDFTVDGNTVVYGEDEANAGDPDAGKYVGAPDLEITFTNPEVGGGMIIEEDTPEEVQENSDAKDIIKPDEIKDETEEEKEQVEDTTSEPKVDETIEGTEADPKEDEELTDETTEDEESDDEEIKEETDLEEPKEDVDLDSNEDETLTEETPDEETGDEPTTEEEPTVDEEKTTDEVETQIINEDDGNF